MELRTTRAVPSSFWDWLNSLSLFYVYQRKYGLDGEPQFSRFQKWYHKHIWLPFARFSKRRIGVPPGDGIDRNGEVFWVEHQGWCCEEWQAEQAIAQYQSGGFHPLPILGTLPVETLPDLGNHVVQTNGVRRRNGKPTVEVGRVDLVKLASKIAQTDGLVEHFKAPVT